jgi:hypothetical protein
LYQREIQICPKIVKERVIPKGSTGFSENCQSKGISMGNQDFPIITKVRAVLKGIQISLQIAKVRGTSKGNPGFAENC